MKWNGKLEQIFRNKQKNIFNNELPNEEKNQAYHRPFKIPFSLNMLVIADTHGCLDEKEIPMTGYDVCFLLGDVAENDLEIIKEIVQSAPIYGVLGNHDGFELLDRFGIENIHGKGIEFNGIKIAGIQGSIRYKNSNMPLYTDEESVAIAHTLPRCADILISHDSPKYIFSTNDFAHSGLQGITDYCEWYNVPLNIHGHHHENRTTILENGTTSICCYGVRLIKGEDYGG